TINSLPSNSTVYFKVFAQNNCGVGAWSNIMQARTNGGAYYKNIISQILSVLPQQTTVLGAKTVSKLNLPVQKINNIPITKPVIKKIPVVKPKTKVLGATAKKSCVLFICL
ncbi:MAG TPA: hypothetical protein VHE53_02640, partial [Patescibacteria group bacterium]|nr:hypothetical protein [Patescibacteria group bacterium]